MNGLERFENVARAYLEANDEQRKAALELIPEDERETFLKGVGLFHLLTDEAFYKEACKAVGTQLYKEFNRGA